MKNITFIIVVVVLSFISVGITMQLTNMRINEIEDKVEALEYDMDTNNHVIKELLK